VRVTSVIPIPLTELVTVVNIAVTNPRFSDELSPYEGSRYSVVVVFARYPVPPLTVQFPLISTCTPPTDSTTISFVTVAETLRG
jgi:hypothetical protein